MVTSIRQERRKFMAKPLGILAVRPVATVKFDPKKPGAKAAAAKSLVLAKKALASTKKR